MRKSLPLTHGGERVGWGKGCIARGTFVFLSGSEGRDLETDLCNGTMGEQIEVIWDKIKSRLEEFGTSCENIVQRMTFVTDMDEFFRHARWYQQRWLRKNAPKLLDEEPASTLIGVPRLHLPEMTVEIQVIAVIPE